MCIEQNTITSNFVVAFYYYCKEFFCFCFYIILEFSLGAGVLSGFSNCVFHVYFCTELSHPFRSEIKARHKQMVKKKTIVTVNRDLFLCL